MPCSPKRHLIALSHYNSVCVFLLLFSFGCVQPDGVFLAWYADCPALTKRGVILPPLKRSFLSASQVYAVSDVYYWNCVLFFFRGLSNENC